jgi:TPR repeat protein
MANFTPKPRKRQALSAQQLVTQWFEISYFGTQLASFKQRSPELKRRLPKIARKMKQDTTQLGRYQYATLLWYLPWLETKDSATDLLSQLAAENYAPAMYMLGKYQFKWMTDVPNGVKLITHAAELGHSLARYRLGTILQQSSWVEKDNATALYWFELAAGKIAPANLKAAEIRLLGPKPELINIERGKALLNTVKKSDRGDPMYLFLMAIYHKEAQQKDIKKSIRYLEKAIQRGKLQYWDTSEWQALLDKMLLGNISVNDLPPQ